MYYVHINFYVLYTQLQLYMELYVGRCAIFFGKLSIVQQQFFIPLHSTIYYCTIIYSNAIVLLIKYKRHSQIKNNQIFVQSTGATIEKLYSGNSIRRIQSRVFFFSLFQFNAIDDDNDNNNNNLTTITANSQPCNFIFILIFVIATVVGARCMVIKQTGRNQQNIAPLLIYIYGVNSDTQFFLRAKSCI